MIEHGPWKTKSSKTVHDSPWIKVDFHDVVNPGGGNGHYSTIHFKNLAIGILPIDNEGYTYLVGQYRYPIKEYSWEIPEGGGPRDIPPLDSAKRELQEETGIVAQNYTEIVSSHLSNSASDEFAIIYIAQDLTFGKSNPEEDEELELKKVHLSEFFKMIDSKEITDSLSVMAGLKAELMYLRGELKIGDNV